MENITIAEIDRRIDDFITMRDEHIRALGVLCNHSRLKMIREELKELADLRQSMLTTSILPDLVAKGVFKEFVSQ